MGEDTFYRSAPFNEASSLEDGRPGPGAAASAQGAPEHPGTFADPTRVVGARVGQYLLDTVLILAGVGVPAGVVSGLASLAGADPTGPLLVWLLVTAPLFSWLVHGWWPHRDGGRTPAMRWLGLRVITLAGTPAGLGKLTLRWVLLLVDGCFYGLVGLITMATSGRHQRVGDIAAGTLVVRAPAPIPPRDPQPVAPTWPPTTNRSEWTHPAAPERPAPPEPAPWTPAPPTPPWAGAPAGTNSSGPLPRSAPPAESDRGIGTGSIWAPPPPPDPGTPPRRRPGLWVAIAAGALVVIALVAVGTVALTRKPTSPPPPALPVPTVFTARPLALPLNNPTNLAVSPDGLRIYITNHGSPQNPGSTLSVIDTLTDTVVGNLPSGPFPADVTLSPDGHRAYVLGDTPDGAPGSVTAVDVDRGVLLGTVLVGQSPGGAAITPDGRTLYVPNFGAYRADTPGNTVSVLDTATMTVKATIAVGPEPIRAAVEPDGRTAYVASYGQQTRAGNTVSVIDTATNLVTNIVTVGYTPSDLASSPDGRTVYVADTGSTTAIRGDVTVIDTASKGTQPLPPVPGGGTPVGVATADGGKRVLVVKQQNSNVPGNTVSLLDTASNTAVGTIDVGDNPYRITVTPDGHHAYLMTYPATGSVVWTVDIP
jgi:YVTN family beta-propeller protein